GMIVLEQDFTPLLTNGQYFDFDAGFEGLAQGTLSEGDGTVTSSERIESPIGPAGRFAGTYPEDDLTVSGFAVVKDNVLLIILVLVPDDQEQFGIDTLNHAMITLRAN